MISQYPSQRLAQLTGHNGPINALTYSSGTGQYLLSGSSDRTINLYNPSKATPESTSNALIQSYSGVHGYEVLSIAVTEDNSRFVSSGRDKIVFLWDVATAKTIRRYGTGPGGHGGAVESVAFSAEGDSVIVSGSYDSTVRLWDTKSQSTRPLMVLSEARDSVSALAVFEHEIMAGSVDGKLRVYDIRMGMVHVDVIGQPITSVTATREGDSILISTLDSTLRLLDKANGKLLQSYRNSDYVNKVYRIRSTFSAHDNVVVSGSETGEVFAWEVLQGTLLAKMSHYNDNPKEQATALKEGKKSVSAVACKTKSSEWASAGGDGMISLWG